MHSDEYKDYIEEFTSNEVNLGEALTDKLIEQLAKKSKKLEKEIDFGLDDLKEELMNLVPGCFKDDSDWKYFIEDLAGLILEEIEANNSDDEDFDDVDDEE